MNPNDTPEPAETDSKSQDQAPASVDQSVIDRHYRNLAGSYDEFLYWSPDFVGQIADKIVRMLRLEADDVLLDLGGGTGMYSLAILERVKLANPVTVVDPFPEMLARIPAGAPIRPVAADAVEYSRTAPGFTKILIKEAIHHIEGKAELFANLFDRLPPGGRLAMVHVDPHLVAYPLFEAALANGRRNFADPDEMVRLLTAAGFEASKDHHVYNHDVPTEHYHRMTEGRYMSIITSLSDRQLQDGLSQMRLRDAGKDRLQFTETFSCVLGVKPN